VAQLMLDRGIGSVPVVNDQGQLVGLVTESDFTGRVARLPFTVLQAPQVFGEFIPQEGIEAIFARARRLTASQVMSHPVKTATEGEPVTDAGPRMIRDHVRRLPVIRAGVPLGMLTRHDVLRLMVRPDEQDPVPAPS